MELARPLYADSPVLLGPMETDSRHGPTAVVSAMLSGWLRERGARALVVAVEGCSRCVSASWKLVDAHSKQSRA